MMHPRRFTTPLDERCVVRCMRAMKLGGYAYFAATGGAGALPSRCVRPCDIVAFADLGADHHRNNGRGVST